MTEYEQCNNEVYNMFSGPATAAVSQKMFGVDEVIRLSMVALYAGGHVLIEGNPGLGKTELVKNLANTLKLPFGRIQFTPDLMPSDITGTYMPNMANNSEGNGTFSFQKGPIFTSLLLADEINRATPKTQSAMLEAMAEKQVTVLGKERKLPAPFFVMATQNPIDNEGTYNLPEAQADRFMFKIRMPIPGREDLQRIFQKCTGRGSNNTESQTAPSSPVRSPEPEEISKARDDYARLNKKITDIVPQPSLETHILNMYLASNQEFEALKDIDKKQKEQVRTLVTSFMNYGLSPRASISQMLGAKAYVCLFDPEGEYAGPAALARIIIPTLRHRISLDFNWAERYRKQNKNTENRDEAWLHDRLLAEFCIRTAPYTNEYKTILKEDPALQEYAAGERW